MYKEIKNYYECNVRNIIHDVSKKRGNIAGGHRTVKNKWRFLKKL